MSSSLLRRRILGSAVLVLFPASVLLVLEACSSDEPNATQDPVVTPLPPPAATSTGNVNPQTAPTSTPPPPVTDTCEDLGQRQGTGLVASYDNGDQWFWGPLAGRPTPTRMGILGSASSAQTVSQVVQLGVGAEANYATCTHCIAIAVGCNGEDCSSATWFFAKSGSSRFDSVATAPGETFSGEFDTVLLTQVTIDPATFVSKEVVGGGCFRIPKATFQATTEAVAPPVDPDGGTDSGTDGGTDGGIDAAGIDSGTATTTNTNNGNHGGRNGATGGLKTMDGGVIK